MTRLAPLLLAMLTCIACVGSKDSEAPDSSSHSLAFDGDRIALSSTDLAKNGFWMAWLSNLAYEEPAVIRRELSKVGARGDFAFFNDSSERDTQAFAFSTLNYVVVVFRGTETFSDWLTDADNAFSSSPFGGVHKGFYEAFQNVWYDEMPSLQTSGAAQAKEGLWSYLKRRGYVDGRPIYFAGHSLGGALATIGSVHLEFGGCAPKNAVTLSTSHVTLENVGGCRYGTDANERPLALPVTALYTYGAPRAGDVRFARVAARIGGATKHGVAIRRYVRGADVVTKLPYFGFWHPTSDGRNEDELVVPIAGTSSKSSLWSMEDHRLPGYMAELRRQLDPSAEPPIAVSSIDERKQRFINAYLNELKPIDFEPIDARDLPPNAAAFYEKKRTVSIDERKQRFINAYLNELKPIDFEPIDARDLPPNAAAFYEKKRTVDVHTLSLLRTVIDGEPVFVVRQMIQKEDGMRQTGFLFDARSFVVAPGQESAEGRTPITFALTDPASDA